MLCRPTQFSLAPASANAQTNTQLIFTQAYLSSVSHIDESTHGLEGTSATGQEVGTVVGLQEANEVGTLCLQNIHTDRLKPCITEEKICTCLCFMTCHWGGRSQLQRKWRVVVWNVCDVYLNTNYATAKLWCPGTLFVDILPKGLSLGMLHIQHTTYTDKCNKKRTKKTKFKVVFMKFSWYWWKFTFDHIDTHTRILLQTGKGS